MKSKVTIFSGIIVLFLAITNAHSAVTVFSDDFSDDGNLNGQTPGVGEAWSVTAGSMTSSGGVMDTANTGGGQMKLAYAEFENNLSLGGGEMITLRFVTVNTSGTFQDWAGISLYEGNTERFFMGLPGSSVNWGIDNTGLGGPAQYTTLPGAAQDVTFTYAYDSGAWTYDVGAQSLSGNGLANLALDKIRIGVDSDADIAVTSITAQFSDGSAVPEPTTLGFIGVALVGLCGLGRRKFSMWR